MKKNIVKRDGSIRPFDSSKIERAIIKTMKYEQGIVDINLAKAVAKEIEEELEDEVTSVYEVEDKVFFKLCEFDEERLAKSYTEFKAVQAFKRQTNTTDESILSLLNRTNEEVMKENSNKDGVLASTQRDLVAGETSKDLARRKLLPAEIVQAHDNGMLHYHDMDYAMQKIFNCCLVNIQDMLDNGTVINGKMVESPKSFQTACTILTQIIAQISSGQYGGQSVNIKHLGKYLARSRKKYEDLLYDSISDKEEAKATINTLLLKELKAGVQTIQYQINTLMTTNGQAPFVTLFLHIEDGHEYEKEIAMIVEEILIQRIEGIKNEQGVYVTPSFPKLIYVLDENNAKPFTKYWNTTRIAAKCTAKRLYPDYISAKRMREIYEGNVFSPMGCRSFLSPWIDPATGKYKFEGRFNMGVVSLNLPQIALTAEGDEQLFWDIFEKRLELCKRALMCRYELLRNTPSDVSPMHWQYGGIARLKKGETIDKLLQDGYATISLGYIGLYEVTKLMTGESHTKRPDFALKVMNKLRDATVKWKEETGLGFGLYGTPAESLCYRFARIDKAKFGSIEDITDKEYYTNSYHVDVREEIDAFSKLQFEAQFQPISTGGCISYVEIPNMSKNLEALEQIISFIYDNIQYAEFNTKSDYCHECGFDGEIIINENLEWECPNCGNKDESKMNVTRRTCGYLGDNFWNKGKTNEIRQRVCHL